MGEEGFGPSNALRGLIYSQLPLTTRPFALHPFVKQALLLSSENQKGLLRRGRSEFVRGAGRGGAPTEERGAKTNREGVASGGATH